jgi:hypothetical protein
LTTWLLMRTLPELRYVLGIVAALILLAAALAWLRGEPLLQGPDGWDYDTPTEATSP